jgi:RNA recognition motif-containing protein
MANEAGARAIEELDGKDYNGRNLKVNEARPREERGPRR